MKLAALLTLTCAACANVDNAGYVLPSGSLAPVSAIVTVVPADQVENMARLKGVQIQKGAKVNGLRLSKANESPCLIYLADTKDGLAALEHELWHCKAGDWHK